MRAQLATGSRPPADTLVVAPYRGIAADYRPEELLGTNVHNAGTYPDTAAGRTNTRFLADVEALHRAGIAYDITDERTVEEVGEPTEGGVRIGRCVYRRVWVDPAALLSPAADALLRSWLIDPPVAPAAADGSASEAMEVQPDALAGRRRPAGAGDAISLRWRLIEPPHNALPLECEEATDGEFAAGFRAEALPAEAVTSLRFADDVTTLTVNDHAVSLVQTEEGSRAALGGLLVTGVNRVRFRRPKAGPRPFVWLEGRFRVLSESRFQPGPGGTLKTEGPFVAAPSFAAADERPEVGDLVAAGLPFLRATVRLEARIELPRATRLLRFHAPAMDAARLAIGGDPATAWSWPKRGELRFELARPLAPGPRVLILELAANGYNAYGPHHYYGGDWHVVSPDQIRGVRNFADPLDAPPCTHVSAWHFRPFAPPASLRID